MSRSKNDLQRLEAQNPTYRQVWDACHAAGYYATIGTTRPDELSGGDNAWSEIIDIGRSYMVGRQVTIEDFLKSHTSIMRGWYRLAFAYCMNHPLVKLAIENDRRHYRVYRRGEYVIFSLPYHDHGGEYDWVSRDGETKVLVNVD